MAATLDSDMQVTMVKRDEIYLDHDFNTRTKITPLDVIDLAKSIKANGLQQPIIIQRAEEHEGIVPPQYKYVMIAGHRRWTAFQVAEIDEIPAIIRSGLTNFQARTINVIENLKRSQLNMLEEANCLEHYIEAGYSRDDMAAELGMSPGWIQIRQMILELPDEIKEEVAKGTFTAVHVRELNGLKKNPLEQITAARKLKEARQKGENKTAQQVLKKAPKATTKKQRVQSEIKEMMLLYKETFGFDTTTQILAWVVGETDNAQLYLAMQEHADEVGKEFTPPALSL